MTFTAIGLASLRASETAIIAYTLPVWTVLLARPLLGERLTAARCLGLVLGLAGVSVLLLAEPPAVAWTKLPGVASALAGAMRSRSARSWPSARRSTCRRSRR